jgi:hypothetical protein
MPEEGRNFLRGKIHECRDLDPSDSYPSSSSGGTDLAGSQTSMDGNSDDEMDLDEIDDETDNEDVDSNYSTEYRCTDAVQPLVLRGGRAWLRARLWMRLRSGVTW